MDRDPAPPRSLPGWFVSLWSSLLFCGPSSACSRPPRLLSLLLLVLVPGVLLYPCLGFHLFEPDESRYAQIPREMLERGDWLVPTLLGEPYLDKPPLFYWLVMGSYRVFGCHALAARLVPALAVHATILLTYLLGRRTLGEPAALAGALVLTLAPGFISVARLLLLDGLLTLFVALSVLAGFEAVRGPSLRWSWWLLAAFACGLGVLTKGPVAVLLLVPPLLLYRPLSRQGCAVGLGGWLTFAGVVLAVSLPWYVALCVRLPGFASYFFWEHNVKRFLEPGMHVRGVWFYAPVLWLLLLPAALLVVPLARFLLSGNEQTARLRSAELGFHLLAGGWVVLFFTLSSCKLPTYILPALPGLSLVLGSFLVQSGWASSRLVKVTGPVCLAVLLIGHHVALPWYAGYRSPMSSPAEVLRLCDDRSLPVVCYPRNCDSIAFYLGRADLQVYRSKDIEELRTLVRVQPRTVILCTHRHSLQGLKELLPPEVRIAQEVRMGLRDIRGVPAWLMKPLKRAMGETALGLCDLAVVEMPPLLPRAERAQAGGGTGAKAGL